MDGRTSKYVFFAALLVLLAVSLAHAVLFILATLEIYLLAALILRRGWAAFLTGPNLMLLVFIEPVVSEALALWLLVSLALAAIFFVYTLQSMVSSSAPWVASRTTCACIALSIHY